MHPQNFSGYYTKLLHKLFAGETESGRSMGGSSFGNFLPINVPKCYRGKIHVFFTESFQSRQYFNIWNLIFTIPIRIWLKLWTLSIKTNTITANAVSKLKCLEEIKKFKFTLQNEDLVFLYLERTWDTFLEVVLALNLSHVEWKRTSQTKIFLRHFGIHFLMIYTDLIEYNTVGDTKALLLRCFRFLQNSSLETL